MGIIYKFKFPNGKCYIGMTKQKLYRRLSVHRRDAKKGCNFAVHRAWRKYGEPIVTIIYEVDNLLLRKYEQQAIKELNTLVPNGYNLTTGGDGGWEISEETREKLSIARKSKKFTEEHKRSLSVAQLGNKKAKGYSQSKEHIAKRALSNTGKKRTQEFKDKMSKIASTKTMSQETKDKIAKSMKLKRLQSNWSTKTKTA
jgi:group I intron endonuclease